MNFSLGFFLCFLKSPSVTISALYTGSIPTGRLRNGHAEFIHVRNGEIWVGNQFWISAKQSLQKVLNTILWALQRQLWMVL